MEQYISYLASHTVMGNTFLDLVIAVFLYIATTLFIKLFKSIIIARLKKLATKTDTNIDDMLVEVVENISAIFYTVTSLYIALWWLSVPAIVETALNLLLILALTYEAIRVLSTIANAMAHAYLEKGKEGSTDERKHNETLINMVRILVRVFLWLIGITIILSYLGINITSIVASLGIGGIAIALALQNILSDIFSSFSIYMDRPFEIGDYVVVGPDSGTVEKIGLKTTRLRALTGEELVIANKELTTARVQNFKRMQKRRVAFTLGVTYETPYKTLKAIPKMIKDEVKEIPNTQWYNAYFKTYGASSLDFEIIFFVKSGDFEMYMKTLEKVNLAIFKRCEQEGIVFAYPTQTIHLGQS